MKDVYGYNVYNYKEENPIAKIEYVKGMYDAQVHKVKQEEYIKNLLFSDYVKKVRGNRSRYDYIEGTFKKAVTQIDKKKKKEREELSIIEEFVRDDFFDNNYNFKITNIVSGGYEAYYWNVIFDGYGQTVCISIPNMNNINVENIKYAHDGMFVFEIKESEYCWRVKKMSYKIEDVAEYIKEYFELDKADEDEY